MPNLPADTVHRAAADPSAADTPAADNPAAHSPAPQGACARRITTQAELRALYARPGERAVAKQMSRLDPHAQRFLALSPFLVLATHGADGRLDASPRGGAPGFVRCLDAQTLLIPDAPGNNRLDSLENLVDRPACGLLCFIPGVDETLRINGEATLSTDPADIARCTDERRAPKLVIRVAVQEAYLHCAKALMRSKLWQPEGQVERSVLPTMAQMIRDQTGLEVALETQAQMVARYQADL